MGSRGFRKATNCKEQYGSVHDRILDLNERQEVRSEEKGKCLRSAFAGLQNIKEN